MKKSIGLITIHNIYNYGSVLQAFATQKIIEDLGYYVEIIDYKYPNKYHKKTNISAKLKTKALRTANGILKDLLLGQKQRTYVRNYKDFQNRLFHLSPKFYPTIKSIIQEPPVYDIYVAGSDQIWRPDVMKGDPCFFLDFIKNKKKIAYASSFGCISIPDIYRDTYIKYLNSFSALGIREESGVKIINELTGRNAKLVLDPTLLLDKKEWENNSEQYDCEKPYLLCYGNSGPDKYMEKLALYIKKHTGYEVIRINGKFYDYFNKDIKYILDAGPAQWLGLFRNAQMILCQSFHATAFAINFEKPFISILKGQADHDSRQSQLLKTLALTDRGITIGDDYPRINDLLLHFDYSSVRKKLENERQESIEFIKNSLI